MTDNAKALRELAKAPSLTGILKNVLLEAADEIEYLLYFYQEADFGPSHEDVVNGIAEYYSKETGKSPPKGYKPEEY